MDNNTWVKLYRKINLNAIMRDATALQLFVWIMTNADKDSGDVTFGRYIVAKELKTNPNTLYSALKRLVSKYKVIEISSTTEYTTISLVNWAKYQPKKESINTSDTNPSTTTHQPVNTIQELRIKNKEINKREITASLIYLKELPPDDLAEFYKKYEASEKQIRIKAIELANYCEGHGKTYKNYRAMLNNALIKDFGMRKAVYVPPPPEPEIPMTPERKAAADARLAEIRARFHPARHKL